MSERGGSKPQVRLRNRSLPSPRVSEVVFGEEPVPTSIGIAAEYRPITPLITLVFYFFLLQYLVSVMPSMPNIWYSNSSALIPAVNENEVVVEALSLIPGARELASQTVGPDVTAESDETQNEIIEEVEESDNETATSNLTEQVPTDDTLPPDGSSVQNP